MDAPTDVERADGFTLVDTFTRLLTRTDKDEETKEALVVVVAEIMRRCDAYLDGGR